MTPDEQRAAEAMVAAYKAMPVIITRPGDYQTRDGRRVTIHRLSDRAPSATGAIWKAFRGTERPRGHHLWDLNGRRQLLVEKPSDIIGHWAPPDHTTAP